MIKKISFKISTSKYDIKNKILIISFLFRIINLLYLFICHSINLLFFLLSLFVFLLFCCFTFFEVLFLFAINLTISCSFLFISVTLFLFWRILHSICKIWKGFYWIDFNLSLIGKYWFRVVCQIFWWIICDKSLTSCIL